MATRQTQSLAIATLGFHSDVEQGPLPITGTVKVQKITGAVSI
ncbi:unnamed protein product [marine sediment metagenome]|uniref:Uncharacterized protein n=1 Tax=marine sediment metagenome TaxID=412755 RepID=X1AYJ3_9ZZZZ